MCDDCWHVEQLRGRDDLLSSSTQHVEQGSHKCNHEEYERTSQQGKAEASGEFKSRIDSHRWGASFHHTDHEADNGVDAK